MMKTVPDTVHPSAGQDLDEIWHQIPAESMKQCIIICIYKTKK